MALSSVQKPSQGSQQTNESAPGGRYAKRAAESSRMASLIKRLLGSACLISFVLATLFYFPLWVYPLVIAAFVGVGLYEFFTMVRHRGILVHRPLSIALGMIFVGLVAWRSMVEPGLVSILVIGQGATAISWMWDVFWPATIVLIFIRQFTRENTFEALGGLATTLFGLAYVAALFSYFLYIRSIKSSDGAWLVTYLILVTKMGDAGAYAVGNWFGRHTLVERISPKKTVEGLAGSLIDSIVTAVLAGSMLQNQTIFGQAPSAWMCGLLGLTLGGVGQLGDLAESLLKRDCQVKDAGTLIPGLGGVLDVIDSLLFTAPLFYGILIYG